MVHLGLVIVGCYHPKAVHRGVNPEIAFRKMWAVGYWQAKPGFEQVLRRIGRFTAVETSEYLRRYDCY